MTANGSDGAKLEAMKAIKEVVVETWVLIMISGRKVRVGMERNDRFKSLHFSPSAPPAPT